MARKITSSGKTLVSKVKGGIIKREAQTGRFMEVTTGTASNKPSKLSSESISATASKRSAALMRLVNR